MKFTVVHEGNTRHDVECDYYDWRVYPEGSLLMAIEIEDKKEVITSMTRNPRLLIMREA
jgi:hypothetical protein